MFNQSPEPLNGLRKFSVKFQKQTPPTSDPTTGQSTPATGPDHGIAEIALETHAPKEGGMGKEAAPNPQEFGGGTKLDPLAEALFPHWMRANGVDPDTTQDHTYDYRGVYKQTQGKVQSPGVLQGFADKINALHASRPPALSAAIQPIPNAPAGLDPRQAIQPIPNAPAGLNPMGALQPMGGAAPDSDPIRALMNLLGQQR